MTYPSECVEGVSEKCGCPIGPGLIHVPESLCTTTICSPHSRCVRGHSSHLRGPRRAVYARLCKLTSENNPFPRRWVNEVMMHLRSGIGTACCISQPKGQEE